MRRLSDNFLTTLQSRFLAALTQQVIADKDLDIQIRENYLNIYYKGNSLLKLSEVNSVYVVDIHEKFRTGLEIPALLDEQTTPYFISLIPALKNNIIRYGSSSLEIEYEQIIIRANNLEPRTNSEYFIIDRQYATEIGRFDLIGLFWSRRGRKQGQVVPLCFMELKFALNSDIKEIHHQLQRYYEFIRENASTLAQENEYILRQKLELGLFNQPMNRIEALKTLRISPDINQAQFIIVLVDHNPNGVAPNLERLKRLPFAAQIRIYRSGFAMWQERGSPVIEPTTSATNAVQ